MSLYDKPLSECVMVMHEMIAAAQAAAAKGDYAVATQALIEARHAANHACEAAAKERLTAATVKEPA